jgi:hypothetical protein
MANLVAAVGIAVSALVAAAGYLINQRQMRRERLARVFAEALSAVSRFRNYPFLVARRPKGESIHWLVEMSAEVHAALDYHRWLVHLEAAPVSREFDQVVATAREEIGEYGKQAWDMPPVERGEDMNRNLGERFPATQTLTTIDVCLKAMTTEMNGPARRPRGTGRLGSEQGA